MKCLIVGLGNPGAEYEETRHNIGFKVVDTIAQKGGTSFEVSRLGEVSTVRFKGRSLILLKPSTFMNLSGKAVRYWMDKEKIPLDRVLIITDDLALPFGTLKVLGHSKYSRLRFGIGAEFSKGRQVDYVLGKWSEEEKQTLPERLERCTALVESYASIGLERTMNFFNNT
jgi:PTH1 family peptidyl-tRNA hydrolase